MQNAIVLHNFTQLKNNSSHLHQHQNHQRTRVSQANKFDLYFKSLNFNQPESKNH